MSSRSIGDIYEVVLGPDEKGWFQHVADDSTQLWSNVIAVFRAKGLGASELPPSLVERREVAFHVHVAIPVGKKMGLWRKVDQADVALPSDVAFRICNEYGNPKIKFSRDWSVWRINQPMKRIGPLDDRSRLYEIGLVVNPLSVIHRMKTGNYNFAYPSG